VAVEKGGFSEKSRKSGDRKCPGDWEKSFVELPDAIQFFQIPSERVFQQPLPVRNTYLKYQEGKSLARRRPVGSYFSGIDFYRT
jgi:hypothetical protein